jgi:RNA polymerase sigma factor CnrH
VTFGATSETELISKAAGGDRKAFSALARSYGSDVLRIVQSSGVTAGEAEDIAQESFLAAWRSLADFDVSRPFRPWLFQIALNKARDSRRRRKVRAFFFGASDLNAPSGLALASEEPSADVEVHHRQRLARVEAAIARLPDELRSALVLVAVVGMTYAEAASTLGVSVKSVEGRLLRARRRILSEGS